MFKIDEIDILRSYSNFILASFSRQHASDSKGPGRSIVRYQIRRMASTVSRVSIKHGSQKSTCPTLAGQPAGLVTKVTRVDDLERQDSVEQFGGADTELGE